MTRYVIHWPTSFIVASLALGQSKYIPLNVMLCYLIQYTYALIYIVGWLLTTDKTMSILSLFIDLHIVVFCSSLAPDGFTHIDYSDVIMGAMVSHITSLTVVNSTIYSGADQRKHQSSASLAFVRGIHRWPVNSPHKGPVTRKMFPFDNVIMLSKLLDHTQRITFANFGETNQIDSLRTDKCNTAACLFYETYFYKSRGRKVKLLCPWGGLVTVTWLIDRAPG